MSAIGDYVHYTRKGYQEYGISHNDNNEKPNKNYNYIKTQINTRMLMNISKNQIDLSNLEDTLNYLLGTENKQMNNRTKIQNYVEQLLSQAYGNTLGTID